MVLDDPDSDVLPLVHHFPQDVQLCWDALKDEASLQEILADGVSSLAVWCQFVKGKT